MTPHINFYENAWKNALTALGSPQSFEAYKLHQECAPSPPQG
jgi:hypothetical protein